MEAIAQGSLDFAISAGCFMEARIPVGLRSVAGAITRKPYLPELERTRRAAEKLSRLAEKLGFGVEIPYRVGGYSEIQRVFDGSGPRVVQVHGPIYPSLRSLDSYYLPPVEYAKTWAASKFILGTGDQDGAMAAALAASYDANLVLHPHIAREMKHTIWFQNLREAGKIGYEADFPRLGDRTTVGPLVWDTNFAVEDIDTMGIGAIPDTSHYLIGANPAASDVGDSLSMMVDRYAEPSLRDVLEYRACEYKRRIIGFHVSGVATNPGNPASVYNGGESLPLNSLRLKPEHVNGMHEFYQHAKQVAERRLKRRIPLVIEIYGWKDGESRELGIERTANALVTGKVGPDIISFPGAPAQLRRV